MWLQILVTLFVVIILFKLFKQRQADKLSLSSFFAWFILWLIVLVVFWQPNTASYLANFLGIGRGADLIIYLSVIVIFYLLFKIFVRLNKIDKEITKIVREDAIKNVKKN
ncbi:DUF2304 domain-containing protein [bacterium]|jgi:small membrane protein|nr:DUF2304 domain-containing protein [bacterium]MBT4649484.1 DUF2304 domain-containing protein [bacterium]